jgi:predicted Zn-dependent protease
MRWYWPKIRQALIRGDIADAEKRARRYTFRYPDDPNSWITLSKVLIRDARYEEAEAALREGLRRSPEPLLEARLGELFLRSGREAEAEEMFRAMLHRDPASRHALVGLLDIAIEKDDWDSAKSLAREAAVALSPKDHWGGYELAFRVIRIPGERMEAIRLAGRSHAAMPDELTPNMLLAAMWRGIDDSESVKYADLALDLAEHGEPVSKEIDEVAAMIAEIPPGLPPQV